MNAFVLAVSANGIPNGKSHLPAVVIWIIVVAIIAILILGTRFLGKRRARDLQQQSDAGQELK